MYSAQLDSAAKTLFRRRDDMASTITLCCQ
jgi:hypothetical protein